MKKDEKTWKQLQKIFLPREIFVFWREKKTKKRQKKFKKWKIKFWEKKTLHGQSPYSNINLIYLKNILPHVVSPLGMSKTTSPAGRKKTTMDALLCITTNSSSLKLKINALKKLQKWYFCYYWTCVFLGFSQLFALASLLLKPELQLRLDLNKIWLTIFPMCIKALHCIKRHFSYKNTLPNKIKRLSYVLNCIFQTTQLWFFAS